MKRIGPLWHNDRAIPGEDTRNHFRSLGMHAYNNLLTFPKLRRAALDAYLLLGGYGIVEFAQRSGWPSEEVIRALEQWVECEPSDSPRIQNLLSVSLESLDIHLYKNQIWVMGQKLHEEVKTTPANESPAGLPNLVTVRLFVGFPGGEQVRGEAYWSKAGGLSGLINGTFWQDKLIDGSGTMEDETRADHRSMAFHEAETHLWEETSSTQDADSMVSGSE